MLRIVRSWRRAAKLAATVLGASLAVALLAMAVLIDAAAGVRLIQIALAFALVLMLYLSRVQHIVGVRTARIDSARTKPGHAQRDLQRIEQVVSSLDRRLASLAEMIAQERVERVIDAERVASTTQSMYDRLFEEVSALKSSSEEALVEVTSVDRCTAELNESLSRATDSAVGHLNKEIWKSNDLLYRHMDALLQLRQVLRVQAPMPINRLRGWTASPATLLQLVNLVATIRPKLIVECGSGVSTLWLGYAVLEVGVGHVVSLEHDEYYLRETRELLAAHRLSDVIDLRHAPLSASTNLAPWYDRSAIEDLTDIDLVFVDGPPEKTARNARYPALELLEEKLSPRATILLDDAAREDERAIVESWKTNFGFEVVSHSHEDTGWAILRRSERRSR